LKNDVGKVAGAVAPFASIATKFIREEPEFEAREFYDFEGRELDERSFWNTLKNDVSKVANTVAPFAGIASKFIREEPEFEAREFDEFEARDFDEFDARELDERSFWNTLKKDFTKVENVVAPVVGIASKFIREEPEYVY
jgi:hypothetical protein